MELALQPLPNKASLRTSFLRDKMSRSCIVVFSTILLAGCSFSLFPSALSRVLLESSHTTTVFDVSASTKRAQDALSLDSQSLKHVESVDQINTSPNSSSFSLPLHPRLALGKPPYKNYESLVRSRLARDAARVKLLNDKLELALNNGGKKFNGKNGGPEVRPEDLGVPVTSGTSQGSGEYFARIGVGQPAKSFYFELDTGSDINWLQCQPCESCFDQSDPIFDPSSSSSYASLSCSSQQCQALHSSGCQNDKCIYQVSYGDGSFTTGEFATETLSFGNSGSIPEIAVGCGHDNEGLFVGSAGLLGLGGGTLSLSSQIQASSFSYCLVDRDSASSSTLEFNSVQPGDSITSPLLENDKFNAYRYVGVTGLSVGGQPLPISAASFQIDESGLGGVIVDSGTVITRFQSQIYNTLRDVFLNLTRHLPPAQGVSLFDTCYDLSSQSDVRVPTVSFEFTGGKSLRLPAKNYLIRLDSAGTFCFAFAPTTSSLSIIGNFQQQGIRVSYDLGNAVVGFSSNQC